MTLPTTSPPPSIPAADPIVEGGAPSFGEIDRSCRVPLVVLWGSAAVWLALGTLFSFLASLKFHAPGMFADLAALSYGRLYPAATNAYWFGFAVPAVLGLMLW